MSFGAEGRCKRPRACFVDTLDLVSTLYGPGSWGKWDIHENGLLALLGQGPSRVVRGPVRRYHPTMPPAPDPVLAAFAELGTVAGVADRLGFDDPEDARQAIHAALRRSDDEITAAGFGYLLELDSANPELGEQ
jgi:hypothetical protein